MKLKIPIKFPKAPDPGKRLLRFPFSLLPARWVLSMEAMLALTWCSSVNDLWGKIRDGKITGFSIGGHILKKGEAHDD